VEKIDDQKWAEAHVANAYTTMKNALREAALV
jgi:hypothetical protein